MGEVFLLHGLLPVFSTMSSLSVVLSALSAGTEAYSALKGLQKGL